MQYKQMPKSKRSLRAGALDPDLIWADITILNNQIDEEESRRSVRGRANDDIVDALILERNRLHALWNQAVDNVVARRQRELDELIELQRRNPNIGLGPTTPPRRRRTPTTRAGPMTPTRVSPQSALRDLAPSPIRIPSPRSQLFEDSPRRLSF